MAWLCIWAFHFSFCPGEIHFGLFYQDSGASLYEILSFLAVRRLEWPSSLKTTIGQQIPRESCLFLDFRNVSVLCIGSAFSSTKLAH
uniref:Secreted protein n=1 Tax=Anguilla anguilla TaxID=7936 RepID=A0A0E9WZT4_ANGAN